MVPTGRCRPESQPHGAHPRRRRSWMVLVPAGWPVRFPVRVRSPPLRRARAHRRTRASRGKGSGECHSSIVSPWHQPHQWQPSRPRLSPWRLPRGRRRAARPVRTGISPSSATFTRSLPSRPRCRATATSTRTAWRWSGRSQGDLNRGSVLISNFNNKQNLQGTGTTIVQVSRRAARGPVRPDQRQAPARGLPRRDRPDHGAVHPARRLGRGRQPADHGRHVRHGAGRLPAGAGPLGPRAGDHLRQRHQRPVGHDRHQQPATSPNCS